MQYRKDRLARKNGELPPLVFKKARKPIPKKSKKLLEAKTGGETELVNWYKARMLDMERSCEWCGKKVNNTVYEKAIFSICHILAKRKTICPSVATHPLNFITLCPDHHTMFDKMNWEEKKQLPFWNKIKSKIDAMRPHVSKSELRHLPDNDSGIHPDW